RATAKLLKEMPEALRGSPEAQLLAPVADDKVYNIIQMIYRARVYEGASKDYEFSRRTMEEHWASGYRDDPHPRLSRGAAAAAEPRGRLHLRPQAPTRRVVAP
ncbi:MAG: DUF3734 domain-containing protein, partial [Reyranellales bacterium]